MENKNKTELLKKIGLNLRTIRLQKGVTPKEMAALLAITLQAYNNIENGKTNLSISQIFEIAQFLKIDFNQVMDIENKRIYNFTTQNNPNSTIQNGEIHNEAPANFFETVLAKIELLITLVNNGKK
jgi:transcriptional regulator with XRE-family HTH domain